MRRPDRYAEPGAVDYGHAGPLRQPRENLLVVGPHGTVDVVPPAERSDAPKPYRPGTAAADIEVVYPEGYYITEPIE